MKRFVQGCRQKGIVVTEPEGKKLREAWLAAFPEMEWHLSPEEDTTPILSIASMAPPAKPVPDDMMDTEDDEEMEDTVRQVFYTATTLTGRRRAKATYCSTCNYPFQALNNVEASK